MRTAEATRKRSHGKAPCLRVRALVALVVSALVCAGGIVRLPSARATPPGLVSVAEVHWTHGIDPEGDPEGDLGSRAEVGPLYLWMRIKGETAALEHLRRSGKLPIRHKWFVTNAVGVVAEGSRPLIDAIALDVGDVERLQALEVEIDGRGYFDWRTWSMKENAYPGVWEVRVVYADNTPVLCEAQHGPCRFSIQLER